MKLIPTTNNTSDNSTLIRKVVTNGLISMAITIIFLSGAAIWTVTQLKEFYYKVDDIDKQIHLIHTMQLSARERTLLMYAMVTENDPFQVDSQRMAFYSAGAKFAVARIEFIKSDLPANERSLAEKQGALTNTNRPTQDKVVDLVINNENILALKLLEEQVIPDQNNILQTLDKINESIENRSKAIKLKAESTGYASVIILISIVIISVFGVLYIIRQTTFRMNHIISDLSETRLSLQNTVHELIQQKDTLDQHAIVSITDEFGSITYVNEKFCEVSGYSRNELIGKNHRMLKSDVHPKEFYQELWDTITAGNIWHGTVCNHRKDGSQYWVESTISPFLDTSGKPYQYVSIRTEITQLLQAKVEAEKASQAKSIFMSSMSHELRTPMNAILGFSQLLEMKLEGNELESIKEIKKSGIHLLALIDEVLELSNLERDNIKLSLEKIDIHTFVRECLLSVQEMARNKNIKKHQKVEAGTPIYVWGDRLRLKQALLNYLTNAIKFNYENGDIFVSIEMVDPSNCRILVKDSGPGIGKEQLSTIFSPFTKSDEHIGLSTGCGIGLSITKRIIESMNGNVGAESEEGNGSTFWIELPTE